MTTIVNRPGHMIITRIVESPAGACNQPRFIYSIKVDGEGFDEWRAIGVRLGPSRFSIDVLQFSAPEGTEKHTP